jgi:hypothetical protein
VFAVFRVFKRWRLIVGGKEVSGIFRIIDSGAGFTHNITYALLYLKKIGECRIVSITSYAHVEASFRFQYSFAQEKEVRGIEVKTVDYIVSVG